MADMSARLRAVADNMVRDAHYLSAALVAESADIIEDLRTHLIRWDNGNVTCLVCGHGAYGGQRIPHDDDCAMAGYTKREHSGPAVYHETGEGR